MKTDKNKQHSNSLAPAVAICEQTEKRHISLSFVSCSCVPCSVLHVSRALSVILSMMFLILYRFLTLHVKLAIHTQCRMLHSKKVNHKKHVWKKNDKNIKKTTF